MYVDDICAFLTDTNLNENLNKRNTELGNISKGMKANCLTLNAEKSQLMIFQRTQIEQNAPCHVYVDGIPLKQCKTIKYLGVHLDDNLKWHSHIDHVNRRVSRVIPVIYNVRNNLTMYSLRLLYHSLLYSILTYCNTVWGNCGATLIGSLYNT